MAAAPQTERLVLHPLGRQDFDHFVTEMLTDPRVMASHQSFRDEVDSGRRYLYRPRPTDTTVT